jgi:hypothetical protein
LLEIVIYASIPLKKVANGEESLVKESVRMWLALNVQSNFFKVDARLTLSGCDMMLGAKWLGILGTILTMEFCYGRRTIKLKKAESTLMDRERFCKSTKMNRKGLILQFSILF